MTQDILQLQNAAQRSLLLTKKYLLSKIVKRSDGSGLQQFLDEIRPGNNYIGVYGTSCGISSLLLCGENLDSPDIQSFKTWLIRHQEEEGGWTLSTFRSKDILVTSTCYVINALCDAGEPFQSSIIQDGLNWLQKNQNPGRGWGFYEADTDSKTDSKTTSTAHVIKTFAKFPEMREAQSAREGVTWLLETRNSDCGWGGDPTTQSTSTAGHTSLVVEALLSAGYPVDSSDIQQPIQFLLSKCEPPPTLNTEVDVFYVNHPDGTATGMHYHLPSLSLATSALLNAQINPLRAEVTRLVEIIISSQKLDGYWSDATAPGKIPIWATMYSVKALRDFVKRVDAIRETLNAE